MAASGSRGWFCYLLACVDGTLYAGITTALGRRLWAEACTDRSAASRREAVVKALPRALKLALAVEQSVTPRLLREAAGAGPPRARRDRTDGDSAGSAAGA